MVETGVREEEAFPVPVVELHEVETVASILFRSAAAETEVM